MQLLLRDFFTAFAHTGLKTAYVDFSLGYNIGLANNLNTQFADFQRTGFSIVFSRFRKEELLAPQERHEVSARLYVHHCSEITLTPFDRLNRNRDEDLTIAIYDNIYADDSILSSAEYKLLGDFSKILVQYSCLATQALSRPI